MAENERFRAALERAQVSAERGDDTAAETASRQAVSSDPDQPAGHALLASALMGLGRLEAAADAAAAAIARAPADSSFKHLAVQIDLKRGNFHAALEGTRECLWRDPYDQRALAFYTFAASALGMNEDVRRLTDVARWVLHQPVGKIGSLDSATPFSEILLKAIEADASLQSESSRRTLVGGARLPDLKTLGQVLNEPFQAMIAEAVEAYGDRFAADPKHPVAAGKPRRYSIASWANVMTAGAYEKPHIHPSGWLCGIYYVAIPEIDRAIDHDRGTLVVGGHDLGVDFASALPETILTPRTGDLVLFPAYMSHATRPFAGAGRRVSIAFKIKPDRG